MDRKAQISEDIRRTMSEQIQAFNQGKSLEKGLFYMQMPMEEKLYYSLWFLNPEATHFPCVFLYNLELNALGSLSKALQLIRHSSCPLKLLEDQELPSHTSYDIFTFGKYRGRHLSDIFIIDPRYLSWVADKFEAHVRNEFTFKELAQSYNKAYINLQSGYRGNTSGKSFFGTPGDKIKALTLKIIKVRIDDDPYRTIIEQGVENFFVDQQITAKGPEGHLFLFTIKAKRKSLASRTLPPGTRTFQVGEEVKIQSAKVLKHLDFKQSKYTKIGYITLL